MVSVLSLAVSSAGCLFGNSPPPALALGGTIGGFQSQCVQEIPQTARDFFTGQQQDDAKIAGMWDCGISALVEFKTLVRGSQPDLIAGRDLVLFLNRFLKEGDRVSDALRVQAMKLKVAVVGGDSENITPAQLDQTVELLNILKANSLALKKLLPMNPAHLGALPEGELQPLLAGLASFGEELGGFISQRGGSLSFDDATAFLVEFEKTYVGANSPGNAITWLRAEMPALRVLKSIVAGGTADAVAQSEWRSTLAIATKLFGTFLYFENQNASQGADWFTTKGFEALARIASRGVDNLKDVGVNHPGGIVPAEKVQQLIATLKDLKGHPDPDATVAASTAQLADIVAKVLLAKQAILGGAIYELDLNRAAAIKTFIDQIHAPALALYQVLAKDDLERATDTQFNAWIAEYDAAAGPAIAALTALRAGASAEKFANFSALTQATAPLFLIDSFTKSVEDTIAEARGARAVLLGPPYDGLAATEWQPLLEQAVATARLYLQSRHRPATPLDGSVTPGQLTYWWTLLNGGASVLDRALQARQPTATPEPGAVLASEVLLLLNALPENFAHKAELVGLVPDALAIKATLFGGDSTRVTPTDLAHLRRFLAAAEAQSYLLRRYLPLDLTQLETWSNERVDELATTLQTALSSLAGAIGSGGTAIYPLASLDALVSKLAGFVNNPSLIADMRDAIPVLGGFKSVAVSEPFDSIAGPQWNTLLGATGIWAALGLRLYHYTKQAPDIYSGAPLERLNTLADAALVQLRVSAASRTPSEINFLDFDHLLDAVYALAAKHGTSPTMRVTTLEAFLRPAIRRLAGGANFGATGRKSNGFSAVTIDLTRARLSRWVRNQRIFEQAFVDLGQDEAALRGIGFERELLLNKLKETKGSEDDVALLQAFRPLFLNQDPSFTFLYDDARALRYSFNDLSKKNLYFIMNKAFLEGYAEDQARANAGMQVTEPEMQRLVVDVHDVITDMRFGPQDQPDAALAQQRFLEANTFTSVANGDGFYDLYEGLEYVGFLGSSKALARQSFADALALCPHSGSDVYGRNNIAAQCFRDRFFDTALMRQYLGKAMPALVAAFEQLTPAGQKDFKINLETAARHGVYSEEPISEFEGENFVTLLSYIESLFKRFDVDGHGQLTMPQARAVFPIVCQKLKDVSKLPGTCIPRWGMLESLFGHLLVYGAPPAKAGPTIGDKIVAAVSFLGWMFKWATIRDCHHCSYRVDRSRVLQIVESLASPANAGALSFADERGLWGELGTE